MGESFVFCPVRLDSRLDSRQLVFDSRFSTRTGIENRELSRESRLAMDCQLTFEWYCNLQINAGTYSAVKSISLILALKHFHGESYLPYNNEGNETCTPCKS